MSDNPGGGDGLRVTAIADGRVVTSVSVLFVAIAAICWVGFALIVAEPHQLLALRFVDLAGDFARFRKGPSEALTVLVLLIGDVMVGVLFLSDDEAFKGFTSRWRLGLVFVALFVFFVAAVYLPLVEQTAASAEAVVIGTIAMAALVVLRGMSYAPPLRVRSVKRVGRAPASASPSSWNRKER